ncbi:stage III sporulation protein AG [Neobacillus terrae]|uniref:stage III sporulation protein AG n=1 Tax=Neobacillus terrae TaxID=3034837 RepID=UPI00140DF919|nr:stage III sporulation protein AG [Neobacillus terrae]NHM32196.1 stage III sporulation protein AG [Neobacillus terrae]
MDKDKGPFSWLKKWTANLNNTEGKKGKYQYMILVLCIGAAFMLAGNMLFKNKNTESALPAMKLNSTQKTEDVPTFGVKKDSSGKSIADYERAYESQIKEALDSMLGVKDVTVVVNIDSSESKVLEKNKVLKNQTTDEIDREGGKRKVEDSSVDEQLVIIRNGDKEVPIVVETKKPTIRGVLVVAKGAQNIQVKKSIIEAVTRALDVPSHRVAVMAKK